MNKDGHVLFWVSILFICMVFSHMLAYDLGKRNGVERQHAVMVKEAVAAGVLAVSDDGEYVFIPREKCEE